MYIICKKGVEKGQKESKDLNPKPTIHPFWGSVATWEGKGKVSRHTFGGFSMSEIHVYIYI
jgi:hypothetical protein